MNNLKSKGQKTQVFGKLMEYIEDNIEHFLKNPELLKRIEGVKKGSIE